MPSSNMSWRVIPLRPSGKPSAQRRRMGGLDEADGVLNIVALKFLANPWRLTS